jgi:hypothetical protein
MFHMNKVLLEIHQILSVDLLLKNMYQNISDPILLEDTIPIYHILMIYQDIELIIVILNLNYSIVIMIDLTILVLEVHDIID